MNIFRRPDYQSEATQFIESLKIQNPQLEKAQREGRALLWDKTINRATAADMATGRVPQKPYVYAA